MTLNTAQYIAPLNSQQVLSGYVQGVKQGVGVSIAPDGTISLDATGAATLGFLVSSSAPAPVFNWSTVAGTGGSVLTNDGAGNVAWSTDYVTTFPIGEAFPHKGAAAIPAGLTTERPVVPEGGFRYNTDFNRLEFFNGASWLPVSPETGGLFSFVTNVVPTANAAGDFWFDTSIGQEKIWDGTAWVETTPLATSLIPGRVKIGTNVQVAADGTISILPTTGVVGGVSNVGVTTITDNVTSFSIDSALSANQGRLLQDQINALVISNNLTLAGLISGAGFLTYVTTEGLAAGFVVGSPLPGASVTNDEYFVIVENAGGFTPPGGAFTTVTQGDWFLSTGASWQFLNVGYDPPYASETVPGIIELATQAETDGGTDDLRAITPLKLANRVATETLKGIAEIATQAEADAGANDTNFLTPKKLFGVFTSGALDANDINLSPTINTWTNVQAALSDTIYDISSPGNTIAVTESPVGFVDIDVVQATEVQLGGAEIATDAETQALVSDSVIVTPLKLGNLFASGAIDANDVLLSPTINGRLNVQDALEYAIYDVASSDGSITITETPTGLVDIVVTQATEVQPGGGHIATQVEANADAATALDTVLITPKKLANRTASETRTGIAELATQAETEAGLDNSRIVTPLKLRTAAVYKSDFNAKGDILSATANDTPQILPVGLNGQVLTANSAAATGLQWETPGIYNIDDISGGFDGVAVTFNIRIGGVAYAPNPSSNIMVFLGGVPQIPGALNAYTIAGSTITFTAAPPTGTTFYATTVRY